MEVNKMNGSRSDLITDQETDVVFFSTWLRDLSCAKSMMSSLEAHNVSYAFLSSTKDYWMRDYMPIQLQKDKLLQYTYNPDYLKKLKNYITDPTSCLKRLRQTPVKSNLVLDGGNVIKCPQAVIMTDKIFQENPKYSKLDLINKIETQFDTELILIPWDKCEEYGHADGMVRYIDNNRVLINNYADIDKSLHKKLVSILQPKFEIEELHFTAKHPSEYNWSYINYLRVGDLILLPSLGVEEDSQALAQFTNLFQANIVQIDVTELVKKGGALNCVSWNVKNNAGIQDYLYSVERFGADMSNCIINK